MRVLIGIVGLLLVVTILWDVFETIVLPRRVRRRFRLTRLFYRITWAPWSALARRLRSTARREAFVSFYGPLSVILLLLLWAVSLIVGFALLHWANGSELITPRGPADFGTDLYFSGTTFATLGLGDVYPRSGLARAITVMEVGTGFGVLALVIGYLPVLYQAFSRREVDVSRLDARAGSPPTAGELLRRFGQPEFAERVDLTLRELESWAAELLESHLSYPALAYYRSQHDNQSWLAALTMVLDLSALKIVGIDGTLTNQSRLTFAMARHASVDLSQIFNVPPRPPKDDRLPPCDLARLRADLAGVGVHLRDGEEADRKLTKLRSLYEPYISSLSEHLLMPLPPWMPAEAIRDDWQSSAWEP